MNKDNITWFQINNVFPIIVSLITVAASFAALNTRISVLESKMDALTVAFNKYEDVMARKLYDVENRYGELSLKVKGLETLLYPQRNEGR